MPGYRFGQESSPRYLTVVVLQPLRLEGRVVAGLRVDGVIMTPRSLSCARRGIVQLCPGADSDSAASYTRSPGRATTGHDVPPGPGRGLNPADGPPKPLRLPQQLLQSASPAARAAGKGGRMPLGRKRSGTGPVPYRWGGRPRLGRGPVVREGRRQPIQPRQTPEKMQIATGLSSNRGPRPCSHSTTRRSHATCVVRPSRT